VPTLPQKPVASHESLPTLPARTIAGVAQLVEHFLAKEDVASSSLVTRSTLSVLLSVQWVRHFLSPPSVTSFDSWQDKAGLLTSAHGS
jgi:hypothetical protein